MLNSPLALPCGAVLSNRLAKAAMTERLSRKDDAPNELHQSIYHQWAKTGTALLISGNIMVDRTHLESAGNVVADSDMVLPQLQEWVASGTTQGNHFWAQINHSGRQTALFVNRHPLSASSVQLKKLGLFGKPRAMTETQIEATIAAFVQTTKVCKQAGFTGVQIHAAHGYLLSQFLSPITNHRQDKWGGSLENRSRMLLEIVRRVRTEVGAAYPISVKLNSADFQRGGFSESDSLEVVRLLDAEGIDLLEISGGTYERLVFLVPEEAEDMKASSQAREAYFLEFAEQVKAFSTTPLMLTGGFRTYAGCEQALESGAVDIIGMARPFLTNLDQLADFIQGKVPALSKARIRTGIKLIESSAEGGFYARQLIRLAKGKAYQPNLSALWSSNFFVLSELQKAIARW